MKKLMSLILIIASFQVFADHSLQFLFENSKEFKAEYLKITTKHNVVCDLENSAMWNVTPAEELGDSYEQVAQCYFGEIDNEFDGVGALVVRYKIGNFESIYVEDITYHNWEMY